MTLAYKYAPTLSIGRVDTYTNYITATSNDTTDPVNGAVVSNDGSITAISAVIAATDKTGTSPTVNLQLFGTQDGTNFVQLKDSAGNVIETGATSISGAGGGTTVSAFIDTNLEGISQIPWLGFRLRVDVGGSATPGWTGTVSMSVIRKPKQAVV